MTEQRSGLPPKADACATTVAIITGTPIALAYCTVCNWVSDPTYPAARAWELARAHDASFTQPERKAGQ